MLNYKQTSPVMSTHHEWEVAFSWGRASILTAEVDKVWRRSVSPVFIIDPVTLLVSACILEVEVIDVIFEPKLLKVIIVDVRQFVCIYITLSSCISNQKAT